MPKNLVALAELDHDCRGFYGCKICEQAYFARSREKWRRLQEKWDMVRKRSNQHQIDAAIVAAVFTPTEEEEKEAVCKQ